jgi:FkbM family methyltransferase
MGLRSWRRKRRVEKAISSSKELDYEGLSVPVTGRHMTRQNVEAIYYGAYEQPEIKAVRALVQAGDRVLELGMGIGIVTGIIARATGPTGRVVTFEANPQLFDPAEKLFKANAITNVEIRNGVLGADPQVTTARFHLAEHYTESGLTAPKGALQAVDVPVTPIGKVVADLQPTVLVCDIEGAEADLVPAMDFSGCRAAIVELHPNLLTRQQVAAIYRHLDRHGLVPRIENSSGTVVAFERVSEG